MEKYLSLYVLLLLCLKVNVCIIGGILVSKKDIDLAKNIVKANNTERTLDTVKKHSIYSNSRTVLL